LKKAVGLLTKIKKKVQSWLAKEAEILHKVGFTPNKVSLTGLIFALLSSAAYATWNVYHPASLLLAAVLLLLSGFCDAIDGVIARIYGEATAFGGFLDSLFDRYADAIVIAGIMIGGLCQIFWGLLALTGSLLVSYARARAEAAGIRMETVGLAERAERILIYVAATLIATFCSPKNAIETMNIATIIVAVLTNITVIQRLIYFYNAVKQN